MKKTRKKDSLLLLFAGAILFWGGISLLLFPAPRFSQSENRLLQEKPRFSLVSLTDGSYTAAWERYAAERMGGRRVMRGVRAKCELMLGKRQSGEVLICPDGSLTKRLSVNARNYQKNLTGIAKLSQKATAGGTKLKLAIAPRRIDACANTLPALFPASAGQAPWRTLTAQLPQALALDKIQGNTHWYRTDHHWTTAGAYEAYLAISRQLNFKPYAPTEFSREIASEAFWGTTDAAAGLLDTPPDKIELWRYEGDDMLCVTKDGTPADFAGLYDYKKLATRDGYAVFLGGNDGITEINRGINDTRPTLLLIKDSFANSVIPFLARHYRIVAVDPRYTNSDPAPLFAEADTALLLMGMQTLTEVALF